MAESMRILRLEQQVRALQRLVLRLSTARSHGKCHLCGGYGGHATNCLSYQVERQYLRELKRL